MSYEPTRVLALYPTSPGYAFAYFPKAGKLTAWAVRTISKGKHKRRNAKTIADIEALLEKCQPDVVVLEDWAVKGSRRSARIRRLHRSIVHAAGTRAIEVAKYTKDDVRSTFASVGAGTRHEIAQAVTREFPELAFRLPKRRAAWDSERAVMGFFSAVALALTHYGLAEAEEVQEEV